MRETYRAHIAAGAQFESDDPLGDQIQQFEEHIGLHPDSRNYVLEQMKLWYKVTGREWDDTPVAAADGNAALADVNIEYTSMADLNRKLAGTSLRDTFSSHLRAFLLALKTSLGGKAVRDAGRT